MQTQAPFKLTLRQQQAMQVLGGDAKNVLFDGGSRSTKTFTFLRALAIRAIAAPASRHAVLRFRFNHVKASVVHDTWPKMMSLCFPQVSYRLDKSDWFAEFPNKSQVWFGGLDDKERTEKILGQEHATIFFNECSQIPYLSVTMALTRLAQKVTHSVGGDSVPLRLKAFYDANPPGKGHWLYKLFYRKADPETNQTLPNPDDYVAFKMNPKDNAENLPAGYLDALANLPARMRLRFLEGMYADTAANALWTLEMIEQWRQSEAPDMVRVVVAVDPSGADDDDNAHNDAIGIVVVGLGTDGNAYVLEDCTVKAGPATWGNVTASAYERHAADKVVGETNYGGEMVKFVVQTAKPSISFKKITATRGKVVRAEPIAALTEKGKVRFVGSFPDLEDELCDFTTHGYIGQKSPNRADAFVFAVSELFPGLAVEKKEKKQQQEGREFAMAGGWMQ